VIRGRIGVGIEAVSKDVAEAIGLGAPRGALVNNVERDGPAAKAGVEAGDVILRFDGRPIERTNDLPRIVGGTKPGTTSTMTVFRKGQQRELKVQVAEAPQDRPRNARGQSEPAKPAVPSNALGLAVSDVPADRAKELGIRGGVQVDAVEGLAAAAGLRAGDIITQMNSAEVQNARQFNEAVGRLDPKKDVAVLVRRGDASRFVVIRR
jgi:serine protease Do